MSLKKEDLLQAALHHRSWGWSIIPAHAKISSALWKEYQTRRPHDRDLAYLFRKLPATGLAVIFGKVSGGLGCCDFDTEAGYFSWRSRFPDLAEKMPTFRTNRGFQVLCRLKDELFTSIKDGEIRAASTHYSIIPPSRHPSGIVYEWVGNFPSGPSSFPLMDIRQTGFLPENGEDIIQAYIRRKRKEKDQNKDIDSKPACVPSSQPGENKSVWEAVRKTIPHKFGERAKRLFALARHLKAIPSHAEKPVESLIGVVRRWHFLAFSTIQTKEWQETWDSFRGAWKNVECAAGNGPLDQMLLKASTEWHPLADKFPDGETKRLISVCFSLQKLSGDNPFFIGCRSAQFWAGIGSRMTAARRLQQLVDCGILKLVVKGSGGTMRRVASTYLFTGVCDEQVL